MKTRKILKGLLPYIIVDYFVRKKKLNINTNKADINDPLYFPEKVKSYSQKSEDLIIDAILNTENGFYIDIGANDPSHLSNTKRFYDKGWKGINIDPNPNCINNFNEFRNNDINLNIGISNKNSSLKFYELTYSTLSSFDKKAAISNAEKFNVKIEREYDVEVFTLNYIFEKYVGNNKVDFISIDTEGYEMEVLNGNDWSVNRPKLIIIETGDLHENIYNFLISNNYEPVIDTHLNAIFVAQNS